MSTTEAKRKEHRQGLKIYNGKLYIIERGAEVFFNREHLGYAYRVLKVGAQGYVLMVPSQTLATGKEPTMGQKTRLMRWSDIEHFEELEA